MRHAVEEIRMRSAMDYRQHGTNFTPAKAAAVMDAEREAEGAPFPKHCKKAPRRLKALKDDVSRELSFGMGSSD